jgi:acyl dehydratase
MEQLYLEDLCVGQRFTSETYVREASRIGEFAAEFDPQPFHIDESAAEASVFNGLAASGWHTAAVAMRLLGVARNAAGRRLRLITSRSSLAKRIEQREP